MKYFVSWTHSDPLFQDFFPDARLLVGPPNVSQTWSTAAWSSPPAELIVDSGAFQHCREGRTPSPAAVLRRQIDIAAGLMVPTGICHLDAPLLGAQGLAELDRRVARNLDHARWLMAHVRDNPLPAQVTPIGVIQGYSVERIYHVAQILEDLGYRWFALGSLAGMVANRQAELLRRVEAATEAVGTNIHVLGVSAATVLADLARLGVASADSGAPMHEACRGGIFYSRPFRRYKLASPHFSEWRRSYSFAEVLAEPLPCECPVCQHDPQQLMMLKGKRFVNMRGVHNYYHLVREVDRPP